MVVNTPNNYYPSIIHKHKSIYAYTYIIHAPVVAAAAAAIIAILSRRRVHHQRADPRLEGIQLGTDGRAHGVVDRPAAAATAAAAAAVVPGSSGERLLYWLCVFGGRGCVRI